MTIGIKGIVESDLTGTRTVIASANSIQLLGKIARITGNTTIKTMLLPLDNPYFIGPLYLYNTDTPVGVWDATGNIALGGTFTRYHVFEFIYDPVVSLWYPVTIV
jgi:hypothetical protein